MRDGQNSVVYRADYQAPAFWIDTVDLCFDLDPAKTRVLNKMKMRRNPDVAAQPPLYTTTEYDPACDALYVLVVAPEIAVPFNFHT